MRQIYTIFNFDNHFALLFLTVLGSIVLLSRITVFSLFDNNAVI